MQCNLCLFDDLVFQTDVCVGVWVGGGGGQNMHTFYYLYIPLLDYNSIDNDGNGMLKIVIVI